MLTWILVVKLLHILSAVALVGGLVARNLTFAYARQASGVQVTIALLALSERFEKWFVRPGSELILVLGLLLAWLERQPLPSVLAGARPAWTFVSLILYLLTIPLVIAFLLPASKRRRQAVAAAEAQRSMTPELSAALNDRSVLVTRVVELAVILVVLAIMVLKPF